MKILGVECSAGPASAAIIEDGKIVGSSFVNIKTTHSQTLMPMIAFLLKSTGISVDELDGIAVAAGPGSFTGIRIGISAVKGLAAPEKIPCVGVSTLRAMAELFRNRSCILCAVMDARCNQVYNALFTIENGNIHRLCEDRALMCDELASELEALERDGLPIVVTGDGTELFYPHIQSLPNTLKADMTVRYQNAVGVGLAAEDDFKSGKTLSPDRLLPVYLRLPQAERELKKKQQEERNGKL